ncbi:zinc finger MYM-type protein 1-like [Aphis gossypii]|uniref:zinc finger MYM-type protein 1-like n=1 Tax=Aphis gossypii TaxID=80765 RepID=UPI002158B5F8|nr:zinc finger MYM-type protein 1-like [Aphis gossypii]
MIELDIDVKVPRLSKKQTNRANHPAKTTEEYYRVSVYIPLLDSVIEDLKLRFLSKENKLLLNLCLLVPRYIVDITSEDFKNIIEAATKLYNFNETELDDKLELQTELELWKTKWQGVKNEGQELCQDALLSIDNCNSIIFPNVHKLIYIIASLPISVASAERSFSTLRRLKTWLRSKMGQDQLTGLALLNIHRSIEINVDDVIDRFTSLKKRNIDFVL